MKKKILIILFTIGLIISSAFSTKVLADNEGGTGYSSGGDGDGKTYGGSSSFAWQVGGPSRYKAGAYKFELVYAPNGNQENRKVLSTVIVQGNISGDFWLFDRKSITTAVKEYFTYLKKNKKVGPIYYLDSDNGINGKGLVWLANKVEAGTEISSLFSGNGIEDEEFIQNLITEFHLSGEDMTQEQDYNPGRWDSYGYRILVQKITLFTIRGESVFADTRKDVAYAQKKSQDSGKGLWYSRINNCVQLFGLGLGYSKELYTQRADIHIWKSTAGGDHSSNSAGSFPYTPDGGNGLRFVRGCEGGWAGHEDKTDVLANYQDGFGYNIIWFSTRQFNYDYSIDAACTNCESTDKENKSLIIQDSTNWNVIKKSTTYKMTNKTIQEHVNNYYYYKKYKTYCREEYTVNFPNANDAIKVKTGRYFTLNASDEDLTNVTGTAIPNFKPVKVTKKRECQVGDSGGNLSGYSSDKDIEKNFLKDTGKVYVKYTEYSPNSHYSMDGKLELDRYDNYDAGSYVNKINGDTLTMQVTYSYTLPKNYYQYISKEDGLSVIGDKSSESGKYVNVGTSNLPISYNNNSKRAAELQFSYDLPISDSYSKISRAYNKGKNDYLKEYGDNESINIYKKYKTNTLSTNEDKEDVQNSACAKMFGYSTSGFKTCANNRQSNKVGDGKENCYTKLNGNIDSVDKNSTSKGYSCIVTGNNKCQYDRITGKYYNSKGNEITETQYNNGDCDADEEPICEVKLDKTGNTVYYGKDGNQVTKDEYNKQCPTKCPSDCEYGCCPSGQCAPMPTVNGMIVCPYGGKKVIYRTIDLSDPFPGQSAKRRKTGSNWCAYDIKSQTIDCDWNNLISSNVIRKENKKTTGEGNGTSIYDKESGIYEVTLNTKTINSIRSYNNKHEYDDFELDCKNNGKACISSFLRDSSLGLSLEGTCARANKSNFYTCDD